MGVFDKRITSILQYTDSCDMECMKLVDLWHTYDDLKKTSVLKQGLIRFDVVTFRSSLWFSFILAPVTDSWTMFPPISKDPDFFIPDRKKPSTKYSQLNEHAATTRSLNATKRTVSRSLVLIYITAPWEKMVTDVPNSLSSRAIVSWSSSNYTLDWSDSKHYFNISVTTWWGNINTNGYFVKVMKKRPVKLVHEVKC